MDHVTSFLQKITRVKTITGDIKHTALKRCLNTFDLTLLGIGHMVGAGIYVLTGTVVREKAGPSAVLSYLFAGIAALLSALCYAEFGAQMPKAGSAYSYTYVTAGEIWGFLVGWNIILESMIGASSVARAWSGTINALFNGAIKNGTVTYVGYLVRGSPWISEYPDLLAAAISVVIFCIVATGAKPSVMFNSVFTILNGMVVLFIMGSGFSHADPAYWTNKSSGGFFPFGFSGTVSAAGSCFFAYIGFEGIAVASEEAKNPAKSVPLATVISMTLVTLAYMGVTSALTLMVPYYDVSLSAAFPEAFKHIGERWAEYLVAVGTLLGISCSLLGGAYSLPRSVYAMADDGLLFGFLAYVHPKTQTPIFSILLFGTVSAIMSIIFDIETLVEFLSIGTLFSYTFVAGNLIILRYLPRDRFPFELERVVERNQSDIELIEVSRSSQTKVPGETSASEADTVNGKCAIELRSTNDKKRSGQLKADEDKYSEPRTDQLYPDLKPGGSEHFPSFNSSSENTPLVKHIRDYGTLRSKFHGVPVLRRLRPGKGVEIAVAVLGVVLIGFSVLLIFGFSLFADGVWWSFVVLVVFIVCVVFLVLVIVVHVQNNDVVTFQVPLVPLLPVASMWVNLLLMLSLAAITWLRLAVWIALGLLVYGIYGFHHSKENTLRHSPAPPSSLEHTASGHQSDDSNQTDNNTNGDDKDR